MAFILRTIRRYEQYLLSKRIVRDLSHRLGAAALLCWAVPDITTLHAEREKSRRRYGGRGHSKHSVADREGQKRTFLRSPFLDPKRTRRPLAERRTSHFQRRVKLITMRFPEDRVRA
jgi:hypothetical protein